MNYCKDTYASIETNAAYNNMPAIRYAKELMRHYEAVAGNKPSVAADKLYRAEACKVWLSNH